MPLGEFYEHATSIPIIVSLTTLLEILVFYHLLFPERSTYGPTYENEILIDLNSIVLAIDSTTEFRCPFLSSGTICDFTVEGIPHAMLRSH